MPVQAWTRGPESQRGRPALETGWLLTGASGELGQMAGRCVMMGGGGSGWRGAFVLLEAGVCVWRGGGAESGDSLEETVAVERSHWSGISQAWMRDAGGCVRGATEEEGAVESPDETLTAPALSAGRRGPVSVVTRCVRRRGVTSSDGEQKRVAVERCGRWSTPG